MKKHVDKKSLWQSLLSTVLFVVFIILAAGSLEELPDIRRTSKNLPGGDYQRTYHFSDYKEVYIGKIGKYGGWQGPCIIKTVYSGTGDVAIEEVNMLNGQRDGTSKTTHANGDIVYREYHKGRRLTKSNKSAHSSSADTSAFQVLRYAYPWLILKLNALGYEDEYVEKFLDTLETVLYTYQFEFAEFNNYYRDVINDLEWTAYDSIIEKDLALRIIQGLEELKYTELRLAVIDHLRSDGKTTFNMIEITYPGYLGSINDSGVNDQDFEAFCQELDSLMQKDGSLDPEDPFFIDSVDVRLFRAIEHIYESGESAVKSVMSSKYPVSISNHETARYSYFEANLMLEKLWLKSEPSDVLDVVGSLMVPQFDQGDILKRAVKETYILNKGVIVAPMTATEFSSHNSATSVTLNGYVMEDGGAVVTSRGIAWAAFYNPTINDNTAASGSGTGDFSVTLEELTEGATYYARTYAINSVDTAYGNCIYFTVGGAVGMKDFNALDGTFEIYPNPASAITTFCLQLESPARLYLTIVDMKGSVTYHADLGNLNQGENHFELDLSVLQNGIYICQLTNKGTVKSTCKLMISR